MPLLPPPRRSYQQSLEGVRLDGTVANYTCGTAASPLDCYRQCCTQQRGVRTGMTPCFFYSFTKSDTSRCGGTQDLCLMLNDTLTAVVPDAASTGGAGAGVSNNVVWNSERRAGRWWLHGSAMLLPVQHRPHVHARTGCGRCAHLAHPPRVCCSRLLQSIWAFTLTRHGVRGWTSTKPSSSTPMTATTRVGA